VPPALPGTRNRIQSWRISVRRAARAVGERSASSGHRVHGGYWGARYDLTEVGHLCQAVTRQGLATWSLEYRRIGNPGGGWPGTLDDVRTGAAHLEKIAAERSLDLKRVVAMVDNAGRDLLAAIHRAGARLIGEGVWMTALIGDLASPPCDGAMVQSSSKKLPRRPK
jgi:hypothetical protein